MENLFTGVWIRASVIFAPICRSGVLYVLDLNRTYFGRPDII
jgi:hypothetical protein